MKWFQHHTNSLLNIKLQELIDEFGMEGYGFWWLTCELLGSQHADYCIKKEKKWKKSLKLFSKLSEEKIEKILNRMATINLICQKSLNKGVLSMPKMAEYSDDYTKRIQRVSEQDTDNVREDKKRREERRGEENIPPKFRYKNREGKRGKELDKDGWPLIIGNIIQTSYIRSQSPEYKEFIKNNKKTK